MGFCSVNENGEDQFVVEYSTDNRVVSEEESKAAVTELYDLSNAISLNSDLFFGLKQEIK